jgi:hypothetical protein
LVVALISTVAVVGTACGTGNGSAQIQSGVEQGVTMAQASDDPVLSVLVRDRASTDGLTGGNEPMLESAVEGFFADMSDVRRAFSSEESSSLRAYVGAGIQPGTVCLVVADGLRTGLMCGELNQLILGGQGGTIAMSISTAQSGVFRVVGVISDDVTSVSVGDQEVLLGENVFVAETSAPVVEVALHTETDTHLVTLPGSQLSASPNDQVDGAGVPPELNFDEAPDS